MRLFTTLSLLLALSAVARASGDSPALDQVRDCAQNSGQCFGASNDVSAPAVKAADASSSIHTQASRPSATMADAPPSPNAAPAKPSFLKEHEDELILGGSALAGGALGYFAAASLVLGPPLAGAVIGAIVAMFVIPWVIGLFHHK